ncbi:MAG: aspartate aminotransferase family protein [Candidatus Heimdallarchaeota archaeon]|nr:aspartate aminotransferase family protein [Candidatus Heimdallarchaeota archaeon]MCK4769493.1 aspartate aminotransferase family protein [Candidatus Heimdallarchaeota archaeon]
MQEKDNSLIFSGATPTKVMEDLQPLVNFQEEGISIEELKHMLEERLLPHLMKYNHPGFLSMFNDFPERGAQMGAELALEYNQGVTDWYVSPGGAMLEELCIKALCSLFRLDSGSDGTFMYSGTYANQEALYLALHWKAEQEGFDFAQEGFKGFESPERLVVLTSVDAHFSLKHAVRILGLGDKNLLTLEVDANRRIDIPLMQKTVEKLQENHDIFCVVATTGTTSTGSIDNVQQISEVCQRIGAWLHVDGAYGLAYCLVPEYRERYSGIEFANSVSWDPHKQFGIPIPNSILFVRRKEDFNRMALRSDYIYREGESVPSPGLKSPPSTRPFSALPLVTSIRFQGITKIHERLRSPLQAIESTYNTLKTDSEIELWNKPETGIICFRIKNEQISENQMNQFLKQVYEEVISSGEHSISFTKLGDKVVLRLVAITPTTAETLMKTVSYVKKKAKVIANKGVQS